jgi:Tol biopolymer transport system component/predicted Ser/Thr protein kinase
VNAERWNQVEHLFHSVSELPAAERRAHLDRACGDDADLRSEIESLLAARDGTLIEGGVARAAAHVIPMRGGWEGQALGAYQLGPLIGAGGMGEVYRARDTKLGREVAIKMLPEALTAGSERRSRFEREARILATLNHPNIAAIYGVEEAGDARGLVLELVDGPTLAERLHPSSGSKALSVAEALGIARQIASACEAAHRRGIIHRDLKPANIKIAADGTVKVLDFGVAKFETAQEPGPTASGVLATDEGAVLGTAAYMSPEQARGLPVDRRTDIWAFGCVLYEMLTGCRSFPGNSSADVLGAITTRDPDWTLLPPDTPQRVRELLRRCLAKDAGRRYHDIADVRLEIEEPDASLAEVTVSGPLGRRLAWLAGSIFVAAAAALLWMGWPDNAAGGRGPTRVSIELPPEVAVYAIGRGSSVALSPDGRRLVYVAVHGDSTRLMSRPLDAIESTPIAGTENATNPFFSPDGRWIGFWSFRTLRKVPAAGGVATTIVEGASYLGASWGRDDTIVYSTDPGFELWRVPSAGGAPQRLTTRSPADLHSWPQLLPGDRSLLYTVWNNSGFDAARIVVQPLAGGDPRVLVERGSFGRVLVSRDAAYLVYARPEGLFAAPFDLHTEQLIGAAMPVQDRVLTNMSGGAHFTVSADGTLAYVPGVLYENDKTLVWVARDGTTTELPPMPGIGFQYKLSPDGKRIARPNAGGTGEANRDLWIDDLTGRTAPIRLTFGEVTNTPVWTPDGISVIYTAKDGNLFLRRADGAGEPRQLTTGQERKEAGSVTPDGTLVYHQLDPKNGFDLWRLSLTGSGEPAEVVRTPRNEGAPKTSPDGRLVAYQSNISGRPEVYVASFPSGDNRVRISRDGGLYALWSRDGREVYYRALPGDREMMAASIEVVNGTPWAGPPVVLFPGPFQGFGDVGPDGRFFLVKPTTREASTRVIQLVFDWFDDLHQKVTAQ